MLAALYEKMGRPAFERRADRPARCLEPRRRHPVFRLRAGR